MIKLAARINGMILHPESDMWLHIGFSAKPLPMTILLVFRMNKCAAVLFRQLLKQKERCQTIAENL